MLTARLLIGFLATWSAAAMAAESRQFDSDGTSLRYLESGSGETVVLLHGFSGSAEGLYIKPGTFNALVDAGYRVVALDQRGHGMSDKPYAEDAYGMNMVEDVRRLFDHLDIESAHLVGYSMGAKVAHSFQAAYPDRLKTLTLGGYGWPWRTPERSLDEAKQALHERTLLPGNDLDALAAVSVGMSALTPAEHKLLENHTPTLAIIGDKDEVVSEANRRALRSTMANLTYVEIPGTHAGPDGAPYKAIFAENLLEFLARY